MHSLKETKAAWLYTLYDINFCEALAVLCQPVYKGELIWYRLELDGDIMSEGRMIDRYTGEEMEERYIKDR